MSEGTTRPNGSREMDVKETTDVEKRIKNAGYDFSVRGLEASFSPEKLQNNENNSGSTDSSAKPSKAGNHTFVGNKITLVFRNLIPFIANGAKAVLKGKGKAKVDKKAQESAEKEGRE